VHFGSFIALYKEFHADADQARTIGMLDTMACDRANRLKSINQTILIEKQHVELENVYPWSR